MNKRNRTNRSKVKNLALSALLLPGMAQAQIAYQRDARVAAKVYHHPDLNIQTFDREVEKLPAQSLSRVKERLGRLGVSSVNTRVDHLSGRFTTLLPTAPLVPGKGVGNTLRWSDLNVAPKDAMDREQVALHSFLDYLNEHRGDLQIDMRELAGEQRVASHGDEVYQFYLERTIGGIPVRGSSISGVVNNGNLVLVNLHQWGDRGAAATTAALSRADALAAISAHIHPLSGSFTEENARLLYLTMANRNGYHYELVWAVKGQVQGDIGNWEALVDANTGEVLAFEDTNHYGDAVGGVFPLSNDGVTPDGVEQSGWPMPFLTITGGTTDSGGNFTATGSLTSALAGPYVKISDSCGKVSLTSSNTINYGTSSGHDCTTPGIGGKGNTHAARTGFYEINRIKEAARGQLPTNTWLQKQLTARMNLNMTCNAYWDGTAVNFFRSGGGCANTGEIAAVFDHEWGHGLDQNGVSPGISGPSGEGIADVYASLRLDTSCIGRGFEAAVCDGNGDPCLTCTGVRDIDYTQHKSGKPHDFTWSNATCAGEVHCTGMVYSEAVWSLRQRELAASPFNMDSNTSLEVATRLTYIGAGATSTWYSGSPPNGGCAASSGYLNYLAADDDNGNLNDGTPHMTAIYGAFNDQQIACTTPAVKNSGCASTPTTAPTVTATAGTASVSLSWTAVSGASKYEVFRTDGVAGCNYGKVKIGETTTTSFSSPNLQSGRNYSYVVIPVGTSDTCMGPASACTTVQPH